MYLRDTLLCMSEAGLYVPRWSQEILDGATRNLVNIGRLTTLQAIRLEERIKEAFPTAIIAVPDNIVQLMTNHPSDRHVLAAAVVARANIIVTSNLKHFQDRDLAPWQIEAKSPVEFLSELYNLYPQQVIAVLQRQSQSLKKPPISFFELLELLSREAPRFTSNIKSQT
ncbi:MAG: PIN domain-containing protein [Nostoc sp.]